MTAGNWTTTRVGLQFVQRVLRYFDEWVTQGLLDPDPDLTAFEASIRGQFHELHANRDSDIHLASGWEARMIEAEAGL